MQLAEAIRGRRTLRRFSPVPIPRELLDGIFELACWAPSAGGNQGYRFVVAGGTPRQAIQDLVVASMPQIKELVAEEFADNPEMIDEVVAFHEDFGGAPVLALAFAGHRADGSPEVLSVCAAIQNLLLAVHEVGLGAAWTGFATVNAAIAAAVDMTDRQLVGIIPIGFPQTVPPPQRRKEGRVQWTGF